MNPILSGGSRTARAAALTLALGACAALPGLAQAETGVGDAVIRIGGVLDLEGRSRGLGLGMRAGIRAAFRGVKVQGKRLEYVTLDDSYTPEMTVKATHRLLNEGVLLMLGNVGTPTAQVSLPILAEGGVPAVGFFTGAGLLRPGVGKIVNFRASYVQETAAVITSALRAGVAPAAICAYVQNDAYGMAGVEGVRRALARQSGTERIVAALETVLAVGGDDPPRNHIGPVGVYTRNTFVSRDGYESLKSWERAEGTACKLVIGVGTYNAIGRFAGYARGKGEAWIVSAVSFTGADDLRRVAGDYGVDDRLIMTQVVPALSSELRIVRDARAALGSEFGYVSLEGYIVGRMLVQILQSIKGEITREKFLAATYGKTHKLGGLTLDFTRDNQGSDSVYLTYLQGDDYKPLTRDVWRTWIN